MTEHVSFQVTVDKSMNPLKLPVCYSKSISLIKCLVLVNTLNWVNGRITDIMSAGLFVAGLKCIGKVSFKGGYVHFHGKQGLSCNSCDQTS